MLESRKTPEKVFRIGRKPDPWQAPDWSRANSDGTFGNRFDDPESHYRVLYAASQKLSCFLETLARFRPDLTLLAELGEIIGADDFLPLGIVPYEWCESRMLGAASTDGEYADIYAAGRIVLLRTNLADECIRLGLGELDAGSPAECPSPNYPACFIAHLRAWLFGRLLPFPVPLRPGELGSLRALSNRAPYERIYFSRGSDPPRSSRPISSAAGLTAFNLLP